MCINENVQRIGQKWCVSIGNRTSSTPPYVVRNYLHQTRFNLIFNFPLLPGHQKTLKNKQLKKQNPVHTSGRTGELDCRG